MTLSLTKRSATLSLFPNLRGSPRLFVSYNFLSEQFPKRVEWDIDNILIVTIDIEVACENGFPSPEQAIEPLLSITVKNHQTKKFVVWGIGKFKNNRDDVTYI